MEIGYGKNAAPALSRCIFSQVALAESLHVKKQRSSFP
jgi:hypothetical protein